MSEIKIEIHYVYIIGAMFPGGDEGPVKVGITKHVGGRLTSISTSCPYPVKLIHAFTAPSLQIARDIESCFHFTQRRYRTNGEWFLMPHLSALRHLTVQIMLALGMFTDLTADEQAIAFKMMGSEEAHAKIRAMSANGSGVLLQ